MDGGRFDAMARQVAGGLGRRRFLRWSLGAAAMAVAARSTPRTVRAQGGAVALGGACAAPGDCQPTGMGTITCADNGIPSDGPTTCCVTRGCCTGDADCCGDQRCAPTGDVCAVCATPPFPNRFPGEACLADTDCVVSVVATVVCRAGRCQAPDAETPNRVPGWRTDPEAALTAAAALARLEAAADYGALYGQMHPDSQAIVPAAAVAGWYADVFAPRGPGAARAIKVRFVDWTWLVNGETYPETAEVTYEQAFAGGPPVRDVVRLVMDGQGAWRWFFGRDRAFVDEQIARYR